MEKRISLHTAFLFIGLLFLFTFLTAALLKLNHPSKNGADPTNTEGNPAVQLSGEAEDSSDSNSLDETNNFEESNNNYEENSGGGLEGSDSTEDNSEEEIEILLSPGCRNVSIAYLIGHFTKEETCNEYIGETCADKTVKCSLQVQNLESSASGLFEIEFTLYEENLIDTSTDSHVLDPGVVEMFSSTFNLQGEKASSGVRCDFGIKTIPQVEICT
jgi:hypothetical protein